MGGTRKAFTVIGIAIMVMASGLIGYWSAPEGSDGDHGVYYQVSTYARLNDGCYGGGITIEELLEHGDYGIGTVEGIDGEMMIIDGIAYRAGTDLVPVEVPSGTMIPFAMMNEFSFGLSYHIDRIDNYSDLRCYLDFLTDSEHHIAFGIEIEAMFESVTIRSVPGQDEPYPPLSEVLADQTTMVLQNVSGTMVGFCLTDELEGINLSGLHLHFISEDVSYAGHVLDMTFEDVDIWVSQLSSVTVTIVGP